MCQATRSSPQSAINPYIPLPDVCEGGSLRGPAAKIRVLGVLLRQDEAPSEVPLRVGACPKEHCLP